MIVTIERSYGLNHKTTIVTNLALDMIMNNNSRVVIYDRKVRYKQWLYYKSFTIVIYDCKLHFS
jgi:hypothetical protein